MFYDRKQAAQLLAGALEKYKGVNAIVIGIPRGGIETAYYIARQLEATLSLVIVRKLGYPWDPELAFGAMAEDGTVYYDPSHQIHMSQEMIDEVEDRQFEEIQHRKKLFREIQLFPDIKGRTVIIADDGIATGSTIIAAIRMCRKRGAAKIVVAAPVCAKRTAKILRQEADELVVPEIPEHFIAVSQFYQSFRDLTDEEAVNFVEQWERKTV